MNDHNPPPIPDPFEPFTPSHSGSSLPLLPAVRDWKSAPPIIKFWAYQLTWLGIILLPILMVVAMLEGPGKDGVVPTMMEKSVIVMFYGVILAVEIWLNRALKKGVPAAWTVQLLGSILGLCGFPLGTAVHGYILSQWWKPEVRTWFGMK